MSNAAKFFKWLVILVIALVILWMFKQCNHGPVKEVVKVKHDTTYSHTRDTVHVLEFVPYKVEYTKEKVLHDTLEKFETVMQQVDTARILEQYFAKRFYADTVKIKYGWGIVNDTVTQNRIVGRSVIIDQNIPMVKETITVTKPSRAIGYFSIMAFGNQKNLPYASGLGLGLKFRNDAFVEVGGLLTRDEPMYMASLKFPIRLKKRK